MLLFVDFFVFTSQMIFNSKTVCLWIFFWNGSILFLFQNVMSRKRFFHFDILYQYWIFGVECTALCSPNLYNWVSNRNVCAQEMMAIHFDGEHNDELSEAVFWRDVNRIIVYRKIYEWVSEWQKVDSTMDKVQSYWYGAGYFLLFSHSQYLAKQ